MFLGRLPDVAVGDASDQPQERHREFRHRALPENRRPAFLRGEVRLRRHVVLEVLHGLFGRPPGELELPQPFMVQVRPPKESARTPLPHSSRIPSRKTRLFGRSSWGRRSEAPYLYTAFPAKWRKTAPATALPSWRASRRVPNPFPSK